MRHLVAYALIAVLVLGPAVFLWRLRRNSHRVAYRKRMKAEDAFDRAAELKRSEGSGPAG